LCRIFAKNTSRETIKFPQPERQGKFCLKTGIFRKYPASPVIYLFNYTEYTFVPWSMRLHQKGVSWTWNTIIFIWKCIFYENATLALPRIAVYLPCLTYFFFLLITPYIKKKTPCFDWSKQISRLSSSRCVKKCKYSAAEGKHGKCFDKYPGGTKIVANSHWLLDNREICLDQSKQGVFAFFNLPFLPSCVLQAQFWWSLPFLLHSHKKYTSRWKWWCFMSMKLLSDVIWNINLCGTGID
jgi:hypothetical protein